MKKYIVVSALGKDRPGFVNRITRAIKELGGNIELQRSTSMADEYALIILFSMPGDPGQVADAVGKLAALRTDDTIVNAREALSPSAGGAESAGCAELVASGADQPGIIDAVTLVLFQDHVNIQSMDYDTESAPMTGEHLFRLSARLAIPKGLDVARLREKLRAMERQYNFDVILRYPVE
jgi:glycine cleavage system transcriptional repressor